MTEGELSRVVRTNAGLCAMWQPESFDFAEFEDWEDWVTDHSNVADAIRNGLLVPLNVGGDGVWQILVRWGENPRLAESEQRVLLVSSEPYLVVSKGRLELGGLEDVGETSPKDNVIPVGEGRFQVEAHLIDWKADPGSVDPSGKPAAAALPDFVVLIRPDAGGPYRTEISSFGRPAG
ncbi:hypothetical protein [Actinoplanes sp. NPDC049802]|uniref:hypothetical protein n=1 Tax=Actinoplanes sp. NPDC049802 TaxID=3154742 RepID=UPI0033E741E4